MNLFKLQKKSKKNYMKLLSMLIRVREPRILYETTFSGKSRNHLTNKVKKGRFTRHATIKVTPKNN